MSDVNANFKKKLIAARYWLLAKAEEDPEYYHAANALELALNNNHGFRKDGKNPKFSHQVSIFHYLRTLKPSLLHPSRTFAVSFLHDEMEDHGYSIRDISTMFTMDIAVDVEVLSKKWTHEDTGQLIEKNYERYFEYIAQNPVASIVKPGDRIHNLQTMVGVFTPKKQIEYATEVETWFLPMIKKSRRMFPQQEAAYENLAHMLKSQIELIRAIHTGVSDETCVS